MIFRRSNDGISNYKHFHRVDYTAYVEGKTDIGYWKTLFSRFRPELKIRYEKKDGIKNMSDIVSGVIDGTIKNVVVCRDSDYRPVLSPQISHARLLRTYGYSFENDFFTAEAASAISRLIASHELDDTFLKRAFRRYLARLSKLGEIILRFDVGFSSIGEGMISKTNPRDLMVGSERLGYAFSVDHAKSRFKTRRQIGPRGDVVFDGECRLYPRYYCGHSILFILIAWCRAVVQNRTGRPQNASNSVIKNHLFSHYEMMVAPETRSFVAGQLRDL